MSGRVVELRRSELLRFEVPSFTDPARSYSVHKSAVSGAWVCGCDSWRWSASTPKSCKHLKALADDLAEHASAD